ncbi:efflux RND transporter permease subunit [Paenibacillus sp. N1-5-1-14]|uniref:efflux RND transporter permease subunit n=1 Tax=Paenibacillus radicibacter TaxID=2972488 RepID=UPI002159574E|nr:efflux RND transporter permease subunit [Paenibacillus radicibacter]MCR8641238.1 efflux RND transporter permease subunit [Paenibacillus radicibacter]
MKGIINFSLNNKFAVWLLTIMITIAGLYAGLNMKQETLPNINVPFLSVTTVYPGAAPDTVVENVTKPIEQRLKNVQGIKNYTATSMENVSSIFVEYDYGQNLDDAMNQMREALDAVKLPDGVKKADISKFSLNSLPVISISASGGKDLEELTKMMEENVKPALEGIPGVASVQVAGQYVKEVQLKFNKDKMKQLGLGEDMVKGIVQGSAIKVPLGMFELDKSDKTVVIDGKITTLDDLKNVVIPVIPTGGGQQAPGQVPANGGQPTNQVGQGNAQLGGQVLDGMPTVKLSEIADIEVKGKAESVSRTNGKESIGIQIVKTNDANTVEVVNGVKDEMKKLGDTYKDIQFITLMDQGKPIEDSVSTMLSKAVFGALFAVFIILIFLRNIRMTLISIVSIPLSLLIAFLVLKQLDITLNMMTLGAMTVAIGRVVDDSIVVIENIYRRMSLPGEKLRGKELIREATREMFAPIFSSTIVTIAVFLPLSLVSGMVGELFLPFALTMVFSLLASLLVAITLVPMMGHSMFSKGLKSSKVKHDDKPDKLARWYQRVLKKTLNHKLITMGIAVLMLIGSFFLVPVIGVSFMPEQQEKYAMYTYKPAPGDRLEDVEKQALEAEKIILAESNVTNMQYSVGGANPLSPGPSKSALFYVQYKSDTKNFEQVKADLLNSLKEKVNVGSWGEMQDMGGMGGSKFNLSVYGEDAKQIQPVVDQIVDIMKNDDSFEKVETSLSKSFEQYTLVADQAKLSKLGLTAGQMAMALSPVRERPTLTEVEVDGKSYKVFIETDKTEYKSIEDIENVKLKSPLGMEVTLKDVAKVEKGTSPNSITRNNGKMVVDVKANITKTDVVKASSDLQKKVEELQKPAGVEVTFGGVTQQINETFTQLGLAMAAAVGVVYFVLVLTFGGALAPFAILFSLPFAIIGGLVGLLIAGETLDVSGMMGALMLIGIVVTNAIVLIDRVRHKEQEGLSTREALLEAGATRLRPILMTALATIGALLPLAFGFESAGMISKGLAVTVIGGLISSTLLTLVIVPIVYEFLAKYRKKTVQE